jgi:hypothetical protein
MTEDFIKLLGIVVVVGFIVYLATKMLSLHMNVVEGLTNPSSSSTSSASNGIAASSTDYASTLKNQVTQLQDTLLVSKYRKEYETIILELDDYVGALMLSTALSINPSSSDAASNLTTIQQLNALNESKSALNNVMKYVDGK